MMVKSGFHSEQQSTQQRNREGPEQDSFPRYHELSFESIPTVHSGDARGDKRREEHCHRYPESHPTASGVMSSSLHIFPFFAPL